MDLIKKLSFYKKEKVRLLAELKQVERELASFHAGTEDSTGNLQQTAEESIKKSEELIEEQHILSDFNKHLNVKENPLLKHSNEQTSYTLQKAITDFNNIMNSSLDVICTINANNEFVTVSKASEMLLGYSPKELIGNKFLNYVYNPDVVNTIRAVEVIKTNITKPTFENRYIHKSGKIVPLLWSANWNEELQLMFCIAKDVTELKKMERAVENERDQFFDMFLNAPSAIGMLKGPNHVFEMINPLCLKLIGKKNVLGKTVAAVLPEVITQGLMEILNTVYQSGQPYSGTKVLVKLNKEGKGELTDAYLNFIFHAYKNNEENIEGIFFFVNDITEQILSTKDVKNSEVFFKAVIENSDDMITMTDKTGKTIYASPAVSRKFGYTMEECLELKITDVVHPDDIEIKQALINQIMLHPGVPIKSHLMREIKKDGTYIWVEGTLTNFLETEGINAIVANFRDETERKKLEDLLDQTNRLAAIGSWEIDVDKGTVYWSDIIKEIREVEKNFIPQLNIGISYFKEHNQEIISQKVKNCIEHGTAWDEELEILTFKGNHKWVRTIGKGEFVNGKCIRVYGSFQDITARKKAELEGLKAYKEKNTILESIGDSFFAMDKEWTVTYWNQQAEKLLLTPRSNILGKNLWDVFPKKDNIKAFEKYQESLKKNKSTNFEFYYEALNMWLEVSAYPSVAGLSVFFKDITDRKLSDIRLSDLNHSLSKHVKDLAASNKELEEFAYVASHDLQEPLRMVTSFLSQIENKYSDVIDEKGKKYIHFAVDGAKRMQQIILDLLEFSRIGRVENTQVKIDLNDILTEVVSLCQNQITETKAVINFKNLPSLKTEPISLRQIFQNLISNSLKYHSKNKLPEINIKAEEFNTHWQFAVSDNGIGIEEEYFEKIFLIFQRLHNKDDYSGTGIGLAVCKKIIENLGGKIWLTSALAKGTTFYFTIPKK